MALQETEIHQTDQIHIEKVNLSQILYFCPDIYFGQLFKCFVHFVKAQEDSLVHFRQ